MTYDASNDHRLDLRNRGFLSAVGEPMLSQQHDVASREEAMAVATTPEALAIEEAMAAMLEPLDNEAVAPSAGLRIEQQSIASAPDGNRINLQIIRPDNDETLPCVYYIHGGAMMVLSCFAPNYRAWGKMLAHQGLCVVMVDFRNSLRPSSVEEVAPYPAGLNDCVSGFLWTHEHAKALNIDPEKIIVAGESGGGNLAIATTMRLNAIGENHRQLGLYALCPYILGRWPSEAHPSTTENNGVLIDISNNHATMAYGIEAYDAKDPMAWPSFATVEDVKDFPPSMISVNECDPLRDEGVAFYRLLNEAGVKAQCRQVMGSVHANELFGALLPDMARTTARDIKGWIEEASLS